MTMPSPALRGRLAPTPTGLLHLGHARTFHAAARAAAGASLVLRIEDLDRPRCKEAYVAAAIADLRWLGLEWDEGPDVGGPCGPYRQSERGEWFLEVWRRLEAAGAIYPSPHSRRDVEEAGLAPHDPDGGGDDVREPLFPPALRPVRVERASAPGGVPWRFRVPLGRTIAFADPLAGDPASGLVHRTAGVDFGDFVVWRRDDLAAYELAVVADDHAMGIGEVVRGADLLTSTARQILLAEALGWPSPAFRHVPLVRDPSGRRLAKRAASLSIDALRRRGHSPAEVLAAPVEALFGAG